jgi:hypothetical protein
MTIALTGTVVNVDAHKRAMSNISRAVSKIEFGRSVQDGDLKTARGLLVQSIKVMEQLDPCRYALPLMYAHHALAVIAESLGESVFVSVFKALIASCDVVRSRAYLILETDCVAIIARNLARVDTLDGIETDSDEIKAIINGIGHKLEQEGSIGYAVSMLVNLFKDVPQERSLPSIIFRDAPAAPGHAEVDREVVAARLSILNVTAVDVAQVVKTKMYASKHLLQLVSAAAPAVPAAAKMDDSRMTIMFVKQAKDHAFEYLHLVELCQAAVDPAGIVDLLFYGIMGQRPQDALPTEKRVEVIIAAKKAVAKSVRVLGCESVAMAAYFTLVNATSKLAASTGKSEFADFAVRAVDCAFDVLPPLSRQGTAAANLGGSS